MKQAKKRSYIFLKIGGINMKTYEVFSTVTVPVSLKISASDIVQAQYASQLLLNQLDIDEIELLVKRLDQSKIKPIVHDHNVEVENIYEEETEEWIRL